MNPESGFNISGELIFSTEENEQRLPIPSSRYEFFRTRRYGMLHFAKRPAPEKANDLIVKESLRKEFLIAYGLNHPGVVRYLHFEEGCIYEEFIEGKTLRQIIDDVNSEAKDRKAVISISRQLLEAVAYIHSKGILHLDIKPENVMITGLDSRVKLIDFSCARSSTCDSTPGFTPGFMAPEQNGGKHADAPTDIYLAGKTIKTLVEAAGIKDRRLKRFIARATDEDPSCRYRSADEALKALPSLGSDKPFPWIITGALAFSFIFSIGLFLLNRPSSELPGARTGESVHDTVIIHQQQEVNALPAAPAPTADLVPSAAPAPTVDLVPPAAPAPTVNREEVKKNAPAPPVVTATQQPLKNDNKDKIANEIEKHITTYFNKNIFPVFKDTVKYQGGVGSREFISKIQAKMSDAFDDIMSYANRLKKQYPEQSTFIDTSVTQLFMGQSNRVNVLLEGR